VVKDRLYTDAAGSARRRSTQTALHRMLGSLCKILAPMLAFTADEAWEFVPGRTVESAHQLMWQPMDFEQLEPERATWKALFTLRELALPALEQARQAKQIGKALEAKLTFTGSGPLFQEAQASSESLRELLNVSQLQLQREEGAVVTAMVSKAEGQKCERCWHWETDVGSDCEHPTICGRCVQAVRQ
jgi:isoleucyl-tRNA synthetase